MVFLEYIFAEEFRKNKGSIFSQGTVVCIQNALANIDYDQHFGIVLVRKVLILLTILRFEV